MKKGRGRGLSIWVPFLFERFREERTRADGRRRPAGPRPPSWVGMVRVCSVGLSCVLCSARRARPGYRNAEAKVANLVKLWIRPALISGYWTATTGPTTSAIGRESSVERRDARLRDTPANAKRKADGHRIDRRRTGTLRLRGPRYRARMKRQIRRRLLITRYRYGHSELVWQADRGDQDPT